VTGVTRRRVAHPDEGHTKRNEAADIAGVIEALDVKTAELVTHDIGIRVGYPLAAGHPGRKPA
jgi:pimeloyl-ACP methyl ester carboxylesterase